MADDPLGQARKHVIEARALVEKQKRLVEELRSRGRDTAMAEHTLGLFRRELAHFEDYLRAIDPAA
jgi:hypothetical protein